MLVMKSGIVKDVKPMQPENVPLPILVMDSGIEKDERPVQPENA